LSPEEECFWEIEDDDELLEFERHSQFGGWIAISNHGDEDMRMIVEAYRSLGLAQEADGLAAATTAARPFPHCTAPGFDGAAFNDAVSAAYGSKPNDTPAFEDRIPLILAFVRDNPRLFAAAT
jgi:hypothetical protein